MSLSRIYSNIELFLVAVILLAFVAGLAHVSERHYERESALGVNYVRSSSPELGD